MIDHALLLLSAIASPAAVQQSAPNERTIQVTGTGMVTTPPDIATLEFWVRGEGQTSDDAARTLAAKQKAIIAALSGMLVKAQIATGQVTVIEARDHGCEDNRGYGSKPQLSQGTCAVIGYVAMTQGSVRTSAVDKAATAVGLAARLGASDARLTGFALADPEAAQRRAATAAIADAKQRAKTAADGAGVPLGKLISIRDQGGFAQGEFVRLSASPVAAPAPPPPPPPPVQIDVKPQPIETRSQVWVSYAIDG